MLELGNINKTPQPLRYWGLIDSLVRYSLTWVFPAEEDAMFASGNVSDEVSDIRSRIERVDDDGDRIAFVPKFVDHGNERRSRSFDSVNI